MFGWLGGWVVCGVGSALCGVEILGTVTLFVLASKKVIRLLFLVQTVEQLSDCVYN